MNENSISNETTQPVVLTTMADNIGIITLNNPHKANCLSTAVITLILDALT